MQAPTTYNVGPHMYRVAMDLSAGIYRLEYSLYGVYGHMEARSKMPWRHQFLHDERANPPGDGKPNAQPWTTSRHTFKTAAAAHEYMEHMTRGQDKPND